MATTEGQSQPATTVAPYTSATLGGLYANAMPVLPIPCRPNKRLKGSENPDSCTEENPAFDYEKILDLPTDVLFNILSFLPPETFYALSISSKRLSTFCYSRNAKTLWKTIRQRQTVYAPKSFGRYEDLRSVPWSSGNRMFQFYDFKAQPFRTGARNLVAETEAEILAEEDTSCHAALALPAPLDGVPEFRLFRYLYGSTCYGSGTRIPELLISLCYACNSFASAFDLFLLKLSADLTESFPRTRMFRKAFDSFEAETTVSRGKYDDLPHYYEFLLSLPYWPDPLRAPVVESLPSVILSPTYRRIYTGHLTTEFTEFMRKKQSMTPSAFETWKVSNAAFIIASRQFARHIKEYGTLKTVYDCYQPRVMNSNKARDKRLLRQALRERMLSQMEYSRMIVDGVLEAHFETHLLPMSRNEENALGPTSARQNEDGPTPRLDDGLWMKLLPSIVVYSAKYAEYKDRTQIASDELAYRVVTDRCDLKLKEMATYEDTLNPGFYLKLPRLQEFLWHSPDLPSPTREQWFKRQLKGQALDLRSELEGVFATVLRDLLKKNLHAKNIRLKALGSSSLTEYDIDHFSLGTLRMHLDDSELFFTCALCVTDLPWYEVIRHPCSANDIGERNYGDREHGTPDTRCIPIGWQPGRLSVATGFEGVYEILKVLAKEESHLFANASAEDFPCGHAEIRYDESGVLFQCSITPHCATESPRLKVTEFMAHLAAHIRRKEATLKTLASRSKPVISVEYDEEAYQQACEDEHERKIDAYCDGVVEDVEDDGVDEDVEDDEDDMDSMDDMDSTIWAGPPPGGPYDPY